MGKEILKLKNITVEFQLRQGIIRAVDNVSLDVFRGEIIGVVGESGSGKSTLASTLLNMVSAPGIIKNGEIYYQDKEMLKLSEEEYRQYRSRDISMVFQAAQNALNPVLTIRDHFFDTVKAHSNMSEKEIVDKACMLMEYVRLQPKQVLDSYPHQLSGGMRQRVIIALSLMLDPNILILDEPTTALDVITQAYIIDLLANIHNDSDITMLFLTHDLSIIAKIADRVAVMYAGNIVEVGTVEDIFYNPIHPYTSGLIHAIPSLIDDLSARRPIPGSPPDLLDLPDGCRFAPRCGYHLGGFCDGTVQGDLVEVMPGRFSTCLEWERMVK